MGITQVLQTQQRPAGVHADVEVLGEFGEIAVELRGEAEQLVAMVVEEGAERGEAARAACGAATIKSYKARRSAQAGPPRASTSSRNQSAKIATSSARAMACSSLGFA